MENEAKNTNIDTMFSMSKNKSWGKTFAGLILIAVGTVWILRQTGVLVPHWVISWKTFLIALGLFLGARQNFKSGGWYVWILLGLGFLLADFIPNLHIHKYIFPVILVVAGLIMIFRRSLPFEWNARGLVSDEGTEINPDDTIDIVSIFGGSKKLIVSKNFKGGDIVSIFGGSEINLSQADIHGPVVLDSVQVFGGAKIYVPSNWTVQSDVTAIFGGVDDRRTPGLTQSDPNKVLVIDGVCLFGGLTIIAY